jgi:hypothetical protein
MVVNSFILIILTNLILPTFIYSKYLDSWSCTSKETTAGPRHLCGSPGIDFVFFWQPQRQFLMAFATFC